MLQPVSARSFSTAELAGVLGISPQAVVKRARRKKWTAEARKIQGGGCLWQCASLDEEAKHKVTVAVISGHRAQEIPNPAVTEARTVYVESLWDSFNEKPNSVKDRAAYRYELLFEAWMLHQSGTTLTRALVLVAEKHGESVGNLRNWYFGTKGKQGVRGVDPKDWLPLLADNYKGRVKRADCHPKAWDFLLKDYLRQEQPSFSMCYERVARVAAQQGWVIPSERTLRRRLKQEHGPAEIRFARTGSLRYAYPDQERRRDAFLAGEAVSGDACASTSSRSSTRRPAKFSARLSGFSRTYTPGSCWRGTRTPARTATCSAGPSTSSRTSRCPATCASTTRPPPPTSA